MKVVIIGAVAGGASAAARFRRLDSAAEIVVVEKGGDVSYAACGLPYYIGGEVRSRSELFVHTPKSLVEKFGVDLRLHTEAVAVDAGAHTVTLKTPQGATVVEGYDKLVLAPGARPIVPDVPGTGLDGVFSLRSVPDADRILAWVEERNPGRALVVGCGFVGLEVAEALSCKGVRVCAVDAAAQVLPNLDGDMAGEVAEYMAAEGLDVRLNRRLLGIEAAPGGRLAARLGMPGAETGAAAGGEGGAAGETVEADMVVLAVGVRPETGFLQGSGIGLDDRGYIITNEYLQTTHADVYAAGDAVAVRHSVSGQVAHIALAGPANRQGRIVADNLAGLKSVYPGAQGSAILKLFGLTVASTGLNEAQARQAGLPAVSVSITAGSHAGYYPGARGMRIKAVYHSGTGVLLGAQVVGEEGADKRADVLAAAVHGRMDGGDLALMDLCYSPPYSSPKDPVNIVGYQIQNQMKKAAGALARQDVYTIPRAGGPLPEQMPAGHPGVAQRAAAGQPPQVAALAEELFLSGGFNCAEAVMRILQLRGVAPVSDLLVKAMTGFGGGLRGGYACGAAAGAVAAIGAVLGRSVPGASRQMADEAMQRFNQLFLEKYGAYNCAGLKKDRETCTGYVVFAVQAAEKVLREYGK